MTAETPAATATADPNAAAAQTTADTTATNATNAEGSQATPPEGTTTNEPQNPDGNKPAENAAPEAYEFAMPEGMQLDEDLSNAVTPILREANVSQETAQKLADALAAHIKSREALVGEVFDKAYEDRRAQEIKEQTTAWGVQANAAKDIGPEVLTRVRTAFGDLATPELTQAVEELGWGNHPELVRLINRLIDYVPPEKGERAASGGGTAQSDYERMYSQADKPTKPFPKNA